jgi:ABC-type dipeptide/oligopeptide/nickel transport system permease subunit
MWYGDHHLLDWIQMSATDIQSFLQSLISIVFVISMFKVQRTFIGSFLIVSVFKWPLYSETAYYTLLHETYANI